MNSFIVSCCAESALRSSVQQLIVSSPTARLCTADTASSEQQVIELTRYVCQIQQAGLLRKAESFVPRVEEGAESILKALKVEL